MKLSDPSIYNIDGLRTLWNTETKAIKEKNPNYKENTLAKLLSDTYYMVDFSIEDPSKTGTDKSLLRCAFDIEAKKSADKKYKIGFKAIHYNEKPFTSSKIKSFLLLKEAELEVQEEKKDNAPNPPSADTTAESIKDDAASTEATQQVASGTAPAKKGGTGGGGGGACQVKVYDRDGNVISDSFNPSITIDIKNPMKTVDDAKEKYNDFLHPAGSITRTDVKTGLFGYYIPEVGVTIVLESISIPIFGQIYSRQCGFVNMEEMFNNKIDEMIDDAYNEIDNTIDGAIDGAIGEVDNAVDGALGPLGVSGDDSGGSDGGGSGGAAEELTGNKESDPSKIKVTVKYEVNSDGTLHSSIYTEAFRLFMIDKKYDTKTKSQSELDSEYRNDLAKNPNSFIQDVYVGGNESWKNKVRKLIGKVGSKFKSKFSNQHTALDNLPITIDGYTFKKWSHEDNSYKKVIPSAQGLTCGNLYVALLNSSSNYMTYSQVKNTIDSQRIYVKGKLDAAKKNALISTKKFNDERNALNEAGQTLDTFVDRNKKLIEQQAKDNKYLL